MKLFLAIYVCSLSIAMAKPNSNLNEPVVVDFKNKGVSLKKLLFTFETFTPQGFRVTVGNATGIDLFAFDGKVNLPIRRSEEGNLPWEQIRPSQDTLTLEFPEPQLLTGDVINFWARIQYNGMSLYVDNIRHIVRDLIPIPTANQSPEPKPTSRPALTPSRDPGSYHIDASDTRPSSQDSRPTADTNNRRSQGCACDENILRDIWAQLNATTEKLNTLGETVRPLEEKVADLTETIDEIVGTLHIGRKLLLTGDLPVRTNPVEDVRHLLIEKLNLHDLSSHILQAAYTGQDISFEVASSVDKLRILKRSKDILSKSKYKIVDPESTDIDIRSD